MRLQRLRRSHVSLAIAGLTTASLLAACGGGDDSGGSAMSEADFCAKATILDSMENVTPDSLGLYQDLTEAAPTAELRSAMRTLLPVIEAFASADENDPDALMAAMAEFNTPEIMAASDALTEYLSGTCQIGDDTSSDGSSSGGESDANEDITFDDLYDEINTLIGLHYGEGVSTLGVTRNGLFPGSEIIIPFDVEGDAMALCADLVDWIYERTDDPNVIIRIQLDDVDIVNRDIDGNCYEL